MSDPLEIIYYDHFLAVINESPGLLVHRNILARCEILCA